MGLESLRQEIIRCEKCPRLVAWRQQVAREKVLRFRSNDYWGKPVPGFGDSRARLLVVGLAPAAHGANRTGRMFTGDRSGEWLYRALHKVGFANQPTSTDREDRLCLHDCFITAAIRCAPPSNKPLNTELIHCRPFLLQEMLLLGNVKLVVALGKIAFEASLNALRESRNIEIVQQAKFAHGAELLFEGGLVLLGSYHPSQQNTFTGRLTLEMFDKIFQRVRNLLDQ